MGIGVDTYTPIDRSPLNIKEPMTLSPMFTPDNALSIYTAWIAKANTTIDIQNPYITQFNRSLTWDQDPNPIVRGIVAAANRGVKVRVQINEGADSDAVAPYLNAITNIEVRYMGDSTSSDGNWISNIHNKLLVIDSKVSLISSINFSENAFLNNRESGMVVQSATVSQYYLKFYNQDWADGNTNIQPLHLRPLASPVDTPITINQGTSFTDIPHANFTGTYNVSAYVNPDNADKHIFEYLKTAKKSIYVSMYTISRQDFVDTLVNLKKQNPSLDIQVLISNRRVGHYENLDTQASAKELVANLIPVYNSTDQLNFYHNKYWIIDQKDTFIYSGNWSPASVTPNATDYTSGDPNRDMGIAVHNAPDIANFVKTQVWDKDVAVADAYKLPVGVSQNSFQEAQIVSGKVSLSATVSHLINPTLSYSFGNASQSDIAMTGNTFSTTIDTTQLTNGITTFKVIATNASGSTFEDEVKVNVVNVPQGDNFRFLITEIQANPSTVSDTKGEYFELTNSFSFPLLLSNWKTGDDNDLYTFPQGYTIAAYTSIILARDKAGFAQGFGGTADIQFSFSLTNTNDYVQLLDQAGNYIDVVAYGSATAPDGSQTVTMSFDAGQSIARSPLYRDTNTAADFVIEAPSPKAVVPHVPLGAASSTSSDIVPFMFWMVLFSMVTLPILRRYK